MLVADGFHQGAERLPVPNGYRELAVLVAEFHGHAHKAFELKPTTILKVLERVDAFRRPPRFEKFVLACEADARGRTGLEDRDYPQAEFLLGAATAARGVDAAAIAKETDNGEQTRERIRRARIRAIADYKADEPKV